MKLILHIGTEKTATTSTQRWFRENRDLLIEQGVYYSRVLGPETHRKLCLWALGENRKDEGFLNHDLKTERDRRAFRKQLPQAFAEEVAKARAAGAHSFVISNEHLHSRLTSKDEVQRVHDFLAPHFDTVSVLCVLRPQVDVAVSLASTLTRDRWPVTKAYFDRVSPKRSFYNYTTLVRRWRGAFGADGVTVLPYRKWPTAAEYLIGELGIRTDGLVPIPRVNEAVDVQVMALVNNLDAPVFGGDQRRSKYSRLFVNKFECNEKISIGPSLAREIQARFDKSNATLLGMLPDFEPADLKLDLKKYDMPPNLFKLEQTIFFPQALSQMVRIMNEKLALEELRTHVMRAELALARNQPKRARALLAKCRQELVDLQDAASVSGDLEAEAGTLDKLQQRLEKRQMKQAG